MTTEKRVSLSIGDRIDSVVQRLPISSKVLSSTSGSIIKQKIDSRVPHFIENYARELTSAIMEESALVAKHCKNTEITPEDVSIILSKSF